jgi:hypothetical protein
MPVGSIRVNPPALGPEEQLTRILSGDKVFLLFRILNHGFDTFLEQSVDYA